MKFVKRVSLNPQMSPGGSRCPEIWEVDTGDFVVIGEDITQRVKNTIPSNIILGEEERIILLPRKVLQSVESNILDK